MTLVVGMMIACLGIILMTTGILSELDKKKSILTTEDGRTVETVDIGNGMTVTDNDGNDITSISKLLIVRNMSETRKHA